MPSPVQAESTGRATATVDRRVAVVVITYNRRDELDRTLGRLRHLPERPKVIVVDNGSGDGTAGMVRARHPEMTLLTPGRNLGAVARNLAVDLLDTPYVAFCDDDMWYEPGALARAADAFDAHPELAVIMSRLLVEPDCRLDPICREMAASPLDRPPGLPGAPVLGFLAGCALVRREAFQTAGGFSARLFLGGEEELLACDLARAGWQLAYLPEVVAHHAASRQRNWHLRRRHGIRNTLWFTWLRRPLASAVRRTARQLIRVPRDRITVLAVADAVRGMPWVLRERKVVPAHLERGYRLLEDTQLDGGARRYVS